MNPIFFNLSKRKKRDLLSELLAGKSTEGIISKKELIALNKIIESASIPAAGVAMGSPAEKRVKKFPVARKKQFKVKKKTTFYLSQEILNSLNKVETKIQAARKRKYLSKISRSQIVDQALYLVLEEFTSQGENSRLMQIIMQET